jgi:hypothetical protein
LVPGGVVRIAKAQVAVPLDDTVLFTAGLTVE